MSPGEIDPQVIRRHLTALRRSLGVLAARGPLSADDLAGDTELLWIVERGLQLCAQNALDVATHIVASHGRDVPDYATAIDELGRLGVIDRGFARDFRNVAGFRNVLVHGYLEVDLEILCGLLGSHLVDFETFAAQVETYLDSV